MLFAFAAAVAAATSTTSSSGHHHHGHIGHRQDHQYIYAFGNHHPHAANRPAPWTSGVAGRARGAWAMAT